MARGRMLSKSLGASRKFAATGKAVVPIDARAAEFPQLLYNLLIPHSDDFGRQPGDAFTVKHVVFPTSPREEPDFEAALDVMEQTGLILRYQSPVGLVLQITNFDPHQSGLHKRGRSTFPDQPDQLSTNSVSSLNASEADVEQVLAAAIKDGSLSFDGLTATGVQQQVRIGNSYLDIVVETAEGPQIVIEVKRQRVTVAAIEQVQRYRDLLSGTQVIPVVIGHGIAVGLQTVDCGVLIATFDARLSVRTVSALDWNGRQITVNHADNSDGPLNNGPSSNNGNSHPAELNRTEPNGTEQKDIYGGADAPQFPRAVEKSKPAKADLKPTSVWKRALGIAHQVIREWPDHRENWSPETKERLQLQHLDPRQRSPRGGQLFEDAVDYAIQQRREQGEPECGRPTKARRA